MKVLGYEEAVTTCDCCGKSNLKGTFAIERDDGEIVHFGSVCVTRHTGKAAKVVRAEAKSATEERKKAARAEYVALGTVAALWKKQEAVRLAGIRPGRTFVDATQAEWLADDAARSLVAAKHGFKSYEIYA